MSAVAYTPDAITAWLVTTCQDLGLNSIKGTDDFFAVGGTSMLAIKLLAKIEGIYGEDILPPSDLFTIRKLDGVAEQISAALCLPA